MEYRLIAWIIHTLDINDNANTNRIRTRDSTVFVAQYSARLPVASGIFSEILMCR